MATAPNSTLDTILEVISGCTIVHACTSEPADFAGIAAVSVGKGPFWFGRGNHLSAVSMAARACSVGRRPASTTSSAPLARA